MTIVQKYITLQELREEILLNADQTQYTDAKLTECISFVQGYIETLTKQFFNLRELTLTVDSEGGKIVVMPCPIVSITKIEVDEGLGFKEYDLSLFNIYNRFYPDDRFYPKIEKINGLFPSGRMKVRVTGSFGFLDENLNTPREIKMITKMLCLTWLAGVKQAKDKIREGKRYFDKNESYERRIAESMSIGHLTQDPEIDNILIRFTRAEAVSLI